MFAFLEHDEPTVGIDHAPLCGGRALTCQTESALSQSLAPTEVPDAIPADVEVGEELARCGLFGLRLSDVAADQEGRLKHR
jgi:hypothetical protein